MAAGLPTEGKNSRLPRAGDLARKDVATCTPAEKLSAVQERVKKLGGDAAVVVNEHKVVMGLLRTAELQKDGDLSIEQAMRPGPSTFRPYISAKEMADYMTSHQLESSPITTSDGKLVGLLYQADAVKAVETSP